MAYFSPAPSSYFDQEATRPRRKFPVAIPAAPGDEGGGTSVPTAPVIPKPGYEVGASLGQPSRIAKVGGDEPFPMASEPTPPSGVPATAPAVPSFKPASAIPTAPEPAAPSADYRMPSLQVGHRVEPGAPQSARLRAKLGQLQESDPGHEVAQTPEGYVDVPPAARINDQGTVELKKPSRWKQAGIGILEGLKMGSNLPNADLGTQLGGGITGGIIGGVSPKLTQAFSRKQEIERTQGELANEQALDLQAAKVKDAQAQPELDQLRINETMRKNREAEAERARDNVRADTVVAQGAERNQLARDRFNEDTRRRKAEFERKEAEKEDITIEGRKFRVSRDTAARILARRQEQKRREGDKPDAYLESQFLFEAESEAEKGHLDRRAENDAFISRLRARREELSKSDTIENILQQDSIRNDIRDIDRQIADAERESLNIQREANESARAKRKAEAKVRAFRGRTSSNGQGKRGTFDLRTWKADHPDATPEEIEAKRAQYAGTRDIIE